ALDAAAALTPEQYHRRAESSFGSVRDTLVHTYSADWVWFMRWQGESPAGLLDPAGYPDVASLRRAWSELEAHVRNLIAARGDDGLQAVISYRLFSGQESAQPLWQLVQHVVNHASYHRGQVTTLIRQVGGVPPKACDLIAFYRENSVVGGR
ncbi:MAG: DinB family protein, partial [Vicinamibacterales bacterium]